MPRTIQSTVRVLATLAFACAGGARALGEYPDYPATNSPPQAEVGTPRTPHAIDDNLYRPAELTNTSTSAPLRLPARLQRPDRQAAGSAELASDIGQGRESLEDRVERSVPLAPKAPESKPGSRSSQMSPFVTGAASLGIVLGLFLMVAWAVRRGMPRNAALLPREAVEILGRAPLVGRQQVHLVRCGNKVLLLSVSAASVETLTEITDQAEVERLGEICRQAGGGAAASFRQVFGQFARPGQATYVSAREEDELDFAHLEVGGRLLAREAHA
jgi:flagellar biogenesis protein FliO